MEIHELANFVVHGAAVFADDEGPIAPKRPQRQEKTAPKVSQEDLDRDATEARARIERGEEAVLS